MHDPLVADTRTDSLPVHCERVERKEDMHPQQAVVAQLVGITVFLGSPPTHRSGSDIKDAGCHVGAFEVLSKLDEPVGLGSAHHILDESRDLLTALHDLLEKLVAKPPGKRFLGEFVNVEIEFVEFLPEPRGNNVAGCADIFSCTHHGGNNRSGVIHVHDEEVDDIRFVDGLVLLPVDIPARCDIEQDAPAGLLASRHIEHHLEIGVDQPCHVFCPLEITGCPVESLGNA